MNNPLPQRSAARKTKPRVRPAQFHIVLDDQEIAIPPQAQTLTGFRAWATSDEFPERGRIDFIDGEIYIDMSPEEIEAHNKVKTEVTCTVGGLIKKNDLGEFYSDRTLISNEEAEVSSEPDAAFASWETLESGRVQFVPKANDDERVVELLGSVDWVLEIISDSSVRKDRVRLRNAYHRAGVREYWLIDARAEAIEFQVLHLEPDGYVAAPILGAGWQASRVFGRLFRLQRRRGRLNRWQYTLQTKPIR
jgi:Uma2 family endonuclease